MSRYIDAELLLEDNTYEWFDDWGNYTGAGLAVVDAPTADVVEVVHGMWSEHKYAEESEGLLISNYECSQCHSWKREESEYCPDCGAKMDGKKVE